MEFNPAVFGENFHNFVQTEYGLFQSLSPLFHIISFAVLVLIFITGNKYRRGFALYGITPVLLGLILFNWIREIVNPEIDYGILQAPKRKFIVFLLRAYALSHYHVCLEHHDHEISRRKPKIV